MIKPLSKYLTLATIVALASCGGGGDDANSTASASTSYWTMDAHSYQNGGYSGSTTAMVGGKPVTSVAVSTATLSGGDTSNGAYSGGVLGFVFIGSGAGTYQVVPSNAALLNAAPATLPIVITSTVGAAVTTGSTQYTATAGSVQVTVDSAGKYHFNSVGALTTTKQIDVLGGVAGAPASMALTIHDAY